MGKISEILHEIGIVPSKGKGQNFLNLADATRLVDAAQISLDYPVIEVGPGLGVMTEVLLRKGHKVYAIEIEKKFGDYLENLFKSYKDKFVLIRSDFRKVNLKDLNLTLCQVVSNVPYVLSSEMMLWMLDNMQYILSASLLLQREFAERIAGVPKTKVYGSLSVHVQAYAEVSTGLVLQGSVFHPPASVESRQLQLKFFRENSPYQIPNREHFERVVRSAFAMRRKKLSSCLEKGDLGLTKIEAQALLTQMGLGENVRAEELSVEQFVNLSNLI